MIWTHADGMPQTMTASDGGFGPQRRDGRCNCGHIRTLGLAGSQRRQYGLQQAMRVEIEAVDCAVAM